MSDKGLIAVRWERSRRRLQDSVARCLSAPVANVEWRSFSIRRADGTLVWDSGDQLEQRTRDLPNVPFNAGHAAEDTEQDNRSDNKGPEPEGVAVARCGAKTYAFIALERVGGIMVYDVTTRPPRRPSSAT